MSIWVVYHKNCIDGFAAAAAVYKYYRGKEEIEFIPLDYPDREEFLDKVTCSMNMLEGINLFVVDFSFEWADTQFLTCIFDHVTVIDHHKTAYELNTSSSLKNVENLMLHIPTDNKKSGALLTWEYLFGKEKEAPLVYRQISDRDTWSWEVEGSKEIGYYLNSLGKRFGYFTASPGSAEAFLEEVEMLDEESEQDEHYSLAISIGNRIAYYTDFLAQDIIKECSMQLKLPSGEIGWAVNAPKKFASDVCNKLVEKHDTFGASWYLDSMGREVWSFRSKKGSGIDVSRICKGFGGGGHENPAGVVGANLVQYLVKREN